jgi:hypothetical protein
LDALAGAFTSNLGGVVAFRAFISVMGVMAGSLIGRTVLSTVSLVVVAAFWSVLVRVGFVQALKNRSVTKLIEIGVGGKRIAN